MAAKRRLSEELDDFEEGMLNQRLDGTTAWAGVRSKYFTATMIPLGRQAEGAVIRGWGATYILRHDVVGGIWELVMFDRGA